MDRGNSIGMGINMVCGNGTGTGTGTATLEWEGTSSTKGKSREKNLKRVNPKLAKNLITNGVSHFRSGAVKSRSTRPESAST